MKPELKTERLKLKPLAESDLETFFQIVTDEFVRKYLFDNEIYGRNRVLDLIKISDETFSRKNYGLWLISLNQPNEIIGFTGLWHFFDEAQPQLLYALLPRYTGRGFAAEAARKIIEYCFSELGLDYVDASCDVPNVDSQCVAEKLGMQKFREETIDGLPTVFFRLKK